MAGFDLPVRAIREQVSSALNLIVHLARLRDGTRRDRAGHRGRGHGGRHDRACRTSSYFDYSAWASTTTARFLGHLKSTGLRPKFCRHLEDLGIDLPAEMFAYEPPARR